MADRRRRRRRVSQDSEDDDESGSGSDSGRSGSPATKSRGREPDPVEAVAGRVEAKKDVESECESEDGVGEAVLSDYDSADPEENGSHSEGVEEEEEAEQYSDEEAPAAASEPKPSAAEVPTQGEEERHEEAEEEEEAEVEGGGGKEESKVEEKGNLAGERQSGDGQESTDDPETKAGGKPGQKLDDDEDRKNPAYIPRKGLFFEHDVRGHTQEEERPKGRNRKLWKDEGRWEHDRFREEEQAPKSREELIAIYGYDIRNGGGSGERPYRQRRPRQSVSPSRDKRWREGGGERAVRSWQSSGGGPNRGGAPPSSIHPSSSSPSSLPLSSAQRSSNSSRPPPSRSRPSHQNQMHLPPQSQYRNNESNAPQMHPRDRQGSKAQSEPAGDRGVVSRGGRGGGGRGGPSVVIEDITVSQGGVGDEDRGLSAVTASSTSHTSSYQSALPRRQQQEQRGSADRSASGLAASTSDPALQSSSAAAAATNREASPPTERPVERKSYSLARRTRSRPADLGSKQPSMEESAAGGNASSPGSAGGKSWTGGGNGPSQAGGGGGGGSGGGGRGSAQSGRTELEPEPDLVHPLRDERPPEPHAHPRRPASVLQHGGDGRRLQPGQTLLFATSESRTRAGAAHAPGSDGGTLLRAHVVSGTNLRPRGWPRPHPAAGHAGPAGDAHPSPWPPSPPIRRPDRQPRHLRRPAGVSVARATAATAASAFLPSARGHDLPLPSHVPNPAGSGPGDVRRRDLLRHDAAAGSAQAVAPPPHIPARHRQAPPSGGALRLRVTPHPSQPPSPSHSPGPRLQERGGRVGEELRSPTATTNVNEGGKDERTEGRMDRLEVWRTRQVTRSSIAAGRRLVPFFCFSSFQPLQQLRRVSCVGLNPPAPPSPARRTDEFKPFRATLKHLTSRESDVGLHSFLLSCNVSK